ncbi:P63C domain-containing protein [Pseudomonas aeruginosa]|uniref:P63C domain-containing protein n=1 Tax=Pseudomonas aeruginosa TaxID=287 RepID=UPI00209B88F7|nr:P63C domain-containing protein [Pseudomonas aeruginosa]MCO7655972.1 P63C domain-containing protein [Pseudomonas aeruginosa]
MTEATGKAKGGVARAKALSSEERSEIAKKAAEARWNKPPKAQYAGELSIGDLSIGCAVLPDGTRVLSQRGVGRALGRGYGGADWKRNASEDAAGKLPFFMNAKGLLPFISNDLMLLVTSPIEYQQTQGGGVAHGIAATALPQICEVWLKARDAGGLSKAQLPVAARAEIIMRGLAHVGITALVDEATGYQEVRDRQALQAILDQFLRKELAAWAKRFPDEFYQQMFRLKGWQRKDLSSPSRRPGAAGMYTNDIVYERLAPGILAELEARNPKDSRGNRKGKHHQMLTEDVGHPALAQHLHALIALMRASSNWDQFMLMLNTAFPKKNETLLLDLQTEP